MPALATAGPAHHHRRLHPPPLPDGAWGGDKCGCTDDRCIGYHHDATDECQCLPVMLDQYYLEAFAPS